MNTASSKTVTIAMKLVQGEDEKLVARSQAKRLVSDFGDAEIVVLDFADVEEIGQGFSDELFRVFCRSHRDVELKPVNMSVSVAWMVSRVTGADKM